MRVSAFIAICLTCVFAAFAMFYWEFVQPLDLRILLAVTFGAAAFPFLAIMMIENGGLWEKHEVPVLSWETLGWICKSRWRSIPAVVYINAVGYAAFGIAIDPPIWIVGLVAYFVAGMCALPAIAFGIHFFYWALDQGSKWQEKNAASAA